MIPPLLCLLLLLAATAPAPAQSQQEMNRQAQDEADAEDRQLNIVYKQVVADLDEEGKVLLKTSQRAWLAYRDAEAKFAADAMRGGSAAPLLYFSSIATLTKQRTELLKNYLTTDSDASPDEPAGAETAKKAAELFYKAYAGHDRKSAQKVAAKTVIDELNWDADAGLPEGLELIDPTHIYYVGGSIELKIKKNSQGRWIIHALSMTAD